MNPRPSCLRPLPIRFALGLMVAAILAPREATAADAAVPAKLGAGATLDTLQAGKTTYQHVQVRSVNARTMMIAHDGGIASVRLRDLSSELQAAFGYNPDTEAAADSAIKNAQARAAQTRAKETQARAEADARKPTAAAAQIDHLVQKFGVPPELKAASIFAPSIWISGSP